MLEEFPRRYSVAIIIPGLPEDGGLLIREAETAGLEIPSYSPGEASRFFFQRHRGWLSKTLRDIDPPALGTTWYYSPPVPGSTFGPGSRRKLYSLGEIERITIWFYENNIITHRQYVITRQLIAWVARGYGIYSG